MTGEQLKLLRVAAGMTQQALGEKAGYLAKGAAQRIWEYESGRKKIMAATATLFNRLLKPTE